jgi:hypothetical protein
MNLKASHDFFIHHFLVILSIETFGGTQTLPFRVGKIQVPLSINPACRQAGLRAFD